MTRIYPEQTENLTPEKTVFKLRIIVAWEADDDEPPIPRYPKREIYNNGMGLFSTLENAVKAMKADNDGDISDIIGYVIEEYGLDMDMSNQWPVSVRSYNPDYTLNDECLVNQNWIKCFNGRPKEKIRFKRGDIVEYVNGDELLLCIVSATPPTPDEIEDWQELDASDDSYLLYDLPDDPNDNFSHHHGDPYDLFKPRKEVPEELKARLMARLEYEDNWDGEEDSWDDYIEDSDDDTPDQSNS